MKINLTQKEIRAIMTCISITEGFINNNIAMAIPKQKKRLKKINLDVLYIKLSNMLPDKI